MPPQRLTDMMRVMSAAARENSTGRAIRVWMEVDLDSNPIRGTLHTPDGPASSFTGWLGLTAALDGMRSEPPAAEGDTRAS